MAISDNIWWTRKAKIQAEKRLLSNAIQAEILLLWYSFAAVAASIYYLKFDSSDNDIAGIAWVIYSVLVLCMSGFIKGLSFKERASLVKECYETLQGILQRSNLDSKEESEVSREYEQILGVCENHLSIDYYKALCETYLAHPTPKHHRRGLDRFPTCFIWLHVGWSYIQRWAILLVFYTLPLFIFMYLERLT